MAANQLRHVMQTLRGAVLSGDEAGLTDGQLLESYLRSRAEAPFATLVRRHGPMVWGVCRRALLSHQDAEDAFQATFLVLVRKGASVVPRDMVANWLYGVAHQTALNARAASARRAAREKQVMPMPEPAARPTVADDLQPLLDQELSRLPARYRAVLVLCELEGKTRKEAARLMNVPEGTVASRLATARAMLAKRMARHSLAVSAVLLAQSAASASMPPALASATIQAASFFVAGEAPSVFSVQAVALADGVLRTMFLTRLRMSLVRLLLVIVLGVGAAVLHHTLTATPDDNAATAQAINDLPSEEGNADWPQWRGPNRDGIVQGIAVPEQWPASLTEEWRVPVGDGVASPVALGGRVYVFTRENDAEVVRSLALAEGKVLWRSEPYPAPYRQRPEERNFSKGPRSTPAIRNGRVYTLGMSGVLSCLDAHTGALLWRRSCNSSAPAVPPGADPNYGGSSPLIADGLCIVHAGDGKKGGLTAFDAMTGEAKWCFAEGYSPMSGSPILVDLAGERQVVTYSASSAAGVSLATGMKLWQAATAGPGQPHTTPVRHNDLLLVADILQPLRALRLEKGDQGMVVKEVWKSKDLPLGYSSPVAAGGLVFGMTSRKLGCFFCLDAATGKTLWESDGRQGDYASLLHAGSVLLFLTERGRLIVARPSAATFEPIAEYQVSDSDTHAHPLFLGQRILIKDAVSLRSFRIGPDRTAQIRP